MPRPQKALRSLRLKYHHVDVFSSRPLSGNGVTVFQLRKTLPTALMQELTREMRQFESIFVLQKAKSHERSRLGVHHGRRTRLRRPPNSGRRRCSA